MRRIGLSRQLGRICGEALALAVLSDAHYGLGRQQEAADCLLHALPIFRDHGVDRLYALCLLRLGQVHEEMSRYPEAAGYLGASLRMFQQLRLPHRVEQAKQALDRCRVSEAATR